MFQRVIRFAILAACVGCGGDVAATKSPVSTTTKSVERAMFVEAKAEDVAERQEFNRESYPVATENDFLSVKQNPLSTFSIDVDTASYANVRRFLNQNHWPPPGAVRLEEIVNYFHYDYPAPTGATPFSAALEVAECPWNPEHRLARIALKGRDIDRNKRPPSNLVFLIDVSGSMNEPKKLPLVKEAFRLLVAQLGENDRVAIAVYASGSGLVLDSTNGSRKAEILYAIDSLGAGGSTNGAAGITSAYEAAVKGFIKGGVNRVILATDGDFNVGVTSDDQLVKLITEKAKTGVFLTTLSVGQGNLQDKKMMELADKGNGNYHYLDSVKEAQKVLVEQMSGTLVTIAKDVKIQVEFNPEKVEAYRLLGYEKRMLKAEDFKDDKKDAGEIGAGHTVTAFYELVPAGKKSPAGKTDPLVFQKPGETSKVDADLANATCLVKLRYKQPDGDTSTEVKFPGVDQGKKYTQASDDFRFAAAAASFAMLLRDSQYKGNATMASVEELAAAAKGADREGYRAEFLKLVAKAKELKK
jgi:Ca-activated chloride channel family protein